MMIVLFTDFGTEGPYVGQMKARLLAAAPGVPVVDLMHDAPRFDARASSCLLAAALRDLPGAAVVVAVVDPGVGGARRALALRCGERWLLGPDNGLLALAARQSPDSPQAHEIAFDPAAVSPSFHGRDVFAPAAAALATGADAALRPAAGSFAGAGWPASLPEVIYVDGFGNAMTGIPASELGSGEILAIGGVELGHARTFCEVEPGQAFWTVNSLGLVEIAVNQGSAAERFGLRVGARLGPAAAVP